MTSSTVAVYIFVNNCFEVYGSIYIKIYEFVKTFAASKEHAANAADAAASQALDTYLEVYASACTSGASGWRAAKAADDAARQTLDAYLDAYASAWTSDVSTWVAIRASSATDALAAAHLVSDVYRITSADVKTPGVLSEGAVRVAWVAARQAAARQDADVCIDAHPKPYVAASAAGVSADDTAMTAVKAAVDRAIATFRLSNV